jgi:hypothetical protein
MGVGELEIEQGVGGQTIAAPREPDPRRRRGPKSSPRIGRPRF